MKKLKELLQNTDEGVPKSADAKKALEVMDTAVKSGTTNNADKAVLKQAIPIIAKYA